LETVKNEIEEGGRRLRPFIHSWPAIIVLAAALGLSVHFFSVRALAREQSQSAKKAPGQSATTHPDSEAARGVFSSSCAGCHGLDGRGGERAPSIASNPRVQHLSDEQISDIISGGIPGTGMPAFSSLTKEQIHSVVGYLRVLQGEPSAAALPGDPARGKQVFFGKGECSTCHSISGEGGFLGPDLTAYAYRIPAQTILEGIVSQNRIVPNGYKLAIVTTHDGDRVEGIVRNEDNFSLQLQAKDGSFHFFQKSDLQNVTYPTQPLMPTNYGERLSHAELNDLVNYLMVTASSSGQVPPTRRKRTEDDPE
jgi:cytochrome c oxidase cbb3-type subunit III